MYFYKPQFRGSSTNKDCFQCTLLFQTRSSTDWEGLALHRGHFGMTAVCGRHDLLRSLMREHRTAIYVLKRDKYSLLLPNLQMNHSTRTYLHGKCDLLPFILPIIHKLHFGRAQVLVHEFCLSIQHTIEGERVKIRCLIENDAHVPDRVDTYDGSGCDAILIRENE